MARKPVETTEISTTETAPLSGEVMNTETGEVFETPTAAMIAAAKADADEFAAPAGTPAIKRHVSIQVLSFPNGSSLIFRALSPIYKGKEIKGEGAKRKSQVDLLNIQSVAGSVRCLVLGAVLKSEIEENYPTGGHIGRWYYVTKHQPKPGQDYATYTIAEIETPDGAKLLPLASFAITPEPTPETPAAA
jgi:hypothetical protein